MVILGIRLRESCLGNLKCRQLPSSEILDEAFPPASHQAYTFALHASQTFECTFEKEGVVRLPELIWYSESRPVLQFR